MEHDPVKITVLVDRDLAQEMDETIPHGFRRHLISSVLRLITGAIKRDGGMIIGAIMSDKYRLVLDKDEKEDEGA